MVKWEDGELISPAKVNEDGTITPAVYEGKTPLSSHNLNKMQDEIIEDGIIVSPTEPQTDRRKVWLKNRKNILPTDFNMWVSGQYNSGTGVVEGNTVRIRLNSLLEVQPGETYYFNTFSDFAFIIRAYDKEGVFSRNIGGIENGNTVITNANEGYLGVTLYKPNGTTTYPLYEDYRTLFENNTIKPMICLNSETDKLFQKYIEPVIYIKNNNGDYEEFIKKEEEKSIIDVYRNDYKTTSTDYEKVNFSTIKEKKGQAFNIQDGYIVCNKDMLVSIEGSYYWTGISGKRVGYKIYKNDASVETFNKFCETGGYYEVSIDRTIMKVKANDKISLYVRTEEGAGGVSGSRGRFIVQEL